jgi:hypothetical protein
MANAISKELNNSLFPLSLREGLPSGPVDNEIDDYIHEIDNVRNDILDYWLMLSNDERETEWNNYTDEQKEELNENYEQLLFMLYWDS